MYAGYAEFLKPISEDYIFKQQFDTIENIEFH